LGGRERARERERERERASEREREHTRAREEERALGAWACRTLSTALLSASSRLLLLHRSR